MFGQGLADAFDALLWIAVIALVSLPFAIWKWIEIIMWLYRHINFTWGE